MQDKTSCGQRDKTNMITRYHGLEAHRGGEKPDSRWVVPINESINVSSTVVVWRVCTVLSKNNIKDFDRSICINFKGTYSLFSKRHYYV